MYLPPTSHVASAAACYSCWNDGSTGPPSPALPMYVASVCTTCTLARVQLCKSILVMRCHAATFARNKLHPHATQLSLGATHRTHSCDATRGHSIQISLDAGSQGLQLPIMTPSPCAGQSHSSNGICQFVDSGVRMTVMALSDLLCVLPGERLVL
jgi:hypothetical protein